MNLFDYKILLVDDEGTLREMVVGFLRQAGFHQVVEAESCRAAEKMFAAQAPHLIQDSAMVIIKNQLPYFPIIEETRELFKSFAA